MKLLLDCVAKSVTFASPYEGITLANQTPNFSLPSRNATLRGRFPVSEIKRIFHKVPTIECPIKPKERHDSAVRGLKWTI
jgi:hypothetical protein